MNTESCSWIVQEGGSHAGGSEGGGGRPSVPG